MCQAFSWGLGHTNTSALQMQLKVDKNCWLGALDTGGLRQLGGAED